MTDLEIVKEIEKELGIKLKKVNGIGWGTRGYTINDDNILTGLGLYECKILDLQRIYRFLEKFSGLSELYLNNNELTDLTQLSSLSSLTVLELSRNHLSDISILSKLSGLTVLGLDTNHLSNISPLSCLSNLTVLNLRNNQLKDISYLQDLIRLTELDLSENQLTDIGSLSKFLDLTELHLNDNQLTNISSLSGLLNLNILNLYNNRISDLGPLSGLINLSQLDLYDNQLTDISQLSELKKLVEINLSGNEISDISPLVKLLERGLPIFLGPPDGFGIFVGDNPLSNPSPSIVQEGRDAVLRHFERIEKQGKDYIHEAKLTLVGEGGAGKTSLQLRLQNPTATLPSGEDYTRGIKVDDWLFAENDGKPQIAHIWDFGGQDINYPVHRFFLTENSVFVLLASTRRGNHNFEYWIPTIYQFGGKSPIILGQICHGGKRVSWSGLGYYMASENFNIIKTNQKPYYELDLVSINNDGLQEIKAEIINQITKLPHFNKEVPTSWVPLRNILSEKSKTISCITFNEFAQICREISPKYFADAVDIEDAADFFSNIGVVLWYKKIEGLSEWVILQPEWAMNAVYKIIDDTVVQKRNGHITNTDFKQLWDDECYNGKHGILKKMLEVFKIGFLKQHTKDEYIIPARLEPISEENRWQNDGHYLHLLYKFDFMPKGLVNQLSADLSKYITNGEEVWSNAVNLEYNDAQCQIEEDFYKREITVKAKGVRDLRTIMAWAMESLAQITKEYKGIKTEIMVPCTCSDCKTTADATTFKYDKLIQWLKKRETVTCNESGEILEIEKLLFSVGLDNITKRKVLDMNVKKGLKMFVSYSKFDESYLEDFKKHTVTLRDNDLVSTFDCRQIEFGKEWDDEIKQQISNCDVMVCLISVDFLNTDYIKYIEIEKAIKENKIIIPIIIKPCDWETSKLGKYQAAQRGRVVALDNNKMLVDEIKEYSPIERAAFWTKIIKEFRKKLFN